VKADGLINSGKFKRIIVSVSGGSDSDLIVDIISKITPNAEYVYFDTGLEYAATKEHLDYLEQRYDIKIQKIRAKTPVPLACLQTGQPFISKHVSEFISRLQRNNFKWQDKPYEELLEEYPTCSSALKWWCNDKGRGMETSFFNINRNKYLKEFMIENPPTFKISNKCCDLAKKHTSHGYADVEDLMVIGIRKAEGGVRIRYNSCTSLTDSEKTYRPIFWYTQDDKNDYEQHMGIKHSRCYSEYGLKRTGCAGCPFGRDFEFELEVLEKYEPRLFNAACKIFKDSYEYTRQYKAFRREKEKQANTYKIGYQMNIFDFLKEQNNG
jgi:3'-phosphoadenosine 5'-phosphosulfate sulfotransferase (PAPS reductase)/FAD synthetase